jgi:hypothetical protein
MSGGNERYRHSTANIDTIIPVVGLCGNGGIKLADDDVITERGDHTRAMCGCYPRQSTDVKMIVVAVRHQHDVDGRQISKGDARIVNALWSDET